jgi:anti-sigma regulatory factor (Ser/Thr protein kinase)
MTDSTETVVRLSPEPASCRGARHAVRDFCRRQGLDDVCESAELLTSELVTNALREARDEVTLGMRLDGRSLAVWVSGDTDSGVVARAVLPDAQAEQGRGLFIVQSLASEWGTSRSRDSTSVWFRLALA